MFKFFLFMMLFSLWAPGAAQTEDQCHALGEKLASYAGYWGGYKEESPTVPEYLVLYDSVMRGVYSCPLCGISVNMGFLRITRSDPDFETQVFYMAIHVLMDHGTNRYPVPWSEVEKNHWRPSPGTKIEDGKITVDVEFLELILSPHPDR